MSQLVILSTSKNVSRIVVSTIIGCSSSLAFSSVTNILYPKIDPIGISLEK